MPTALAPKHLDDQLTATVASESEIPEPPSATGHYPGPIWTANEAEESDIQAGATTLDQQADSEVPEPPGATGHYPGPIWVEDAGASAMPFAATTDGSLAPAAAGTLISLKEADYSDDIGEAPDPERKDSETRLQTILDNQEMYRIIREVALADSGDELYAAVSANREYETVGQPIYQQRQFGLGFGLVLFTQESGRLGSVLRLMQRRDATTFADVFGPLADELLQSATAPTPQERLKPVGGEVLWSDTWIARFRRAGAVVAFQAAQNEEAIEGQFRPMLNIAFSMGLDTDRGLAMVYDRVVTRGLGGGLRWVVEAAGPLRTAAQREHALDVLGFQDIREFQQVVGWTRQDGRFGPDTHAALVGALRRQGLMSLPGADELIGRLVAESIGSARNRLMRLRDSAALHDIAYSLG